MTVTGLIGGIALLGVALVALIAPFVQQRRSNNQLEADAQKKRDEFLTSYERVLATIRDLDEDHETGKLAPNTYQREREYWTEQGILLLEELEIDSDEAIVEDRVPEKSDLPADKVLDDAIEKAIAEYRGEHT